MRIAVVYSLPTKRALQSPFIATEEDTAESAKEVATALKTKGAQVTLVAIAENKISDLKTIRADCILNLIEWTGLDLPLSLEAIGLLETLGLPFTGADLSNFATTSDKVKMKQALEVASLPTARWQLFTTGQESPRPDFHYPVILKLAWEHCSIGLTQDAVVEDEKALAGAASERLNFFHQPVYAEEFIVGREFQLTVFDSTSGIRVLPAAEIVFTRPSYNFLTYTGRWEEKHPDFAASRVEVAQITPSLTARLEKLGLTTFAKLDFKDYARLDLRVRGEEFFILEANSNPGLGDDEEYGMTVSYKAVGLTFADFVWEIVLSALRRFKGSPGA